MAVTLSVDFASIDGNKAPSFTIAKVNGIRCAIVRAVFGRPLGEGSGPYLDPSWQLYRGQIKAAGLKRGAYLFLCVPRKDRKFTPSPEDQAMTFTKYVELVPGQDLPPILDVEEASDVLTHAEYLDWVLRAQKLGFRLRYVPDMIQYHYVDASRLTLPYIMNKAYKRTASRIRVNTPAVDHQVPRYLYRKLVQYLLSALTAISQARRRFYLVRTAAALGEINGHLHLRRLARRAP